MKTVEESILEMHKKGGNTRLTMDLLKQLRNQEQKVTDTVYEFFRDKLKDNQRLKATARHHYNSYLANDSSWGGFDNWYKKCIYNMDSPGWKEGVEEWLGQMGHNGEFEQYLEDVKFQDFLKSMDYYCDVKFTYSDGSYPGDVYSMLVDPSVHINVKFLERPLSYGK